ncbi:MAG: nucleotidyltransferase domain-containing protein, partial [Candidatus Andersenbacteria bacterium]
MLPRSFQKAIQAIKNLEGNPRYIGAFIFGSVARGEVTKNSDLDVKVITGETTTCENINHPLIGGVKLDITFLSFGKLKQQMVLEEKTGRIPMIAESIIVFDTNNILSSLKQAKLKVQPRKFSKSDYQNQQFFIYHADDKVRRNLEEDPDSALLGMHVGIQELIKIHYELHGHWKVSSK